MASAGAVAAAPDAPSGSRARLQSPGAQVALDEFEVLGSDSGRSLGKGSFGVVRRIRHRGTSDVYALKTMQKLEVIEGDLIDQVEREIQVQRALKHENILRLYKHFEDADTVYLLLEYCAKGELYQLLRTRRGRRFPEDMARHYFAQVTRGLQYLHSQCIVHRDLKPENLLVTHDDVLKIADFGWCAVSTVTRTTFCGTLDYLAPEMIQGKGHNHTLDIWSLGVLLYEMLVGRPPFQSTNHLTLIAKILATELKFPTSVPSAVRDLVKRLLQHEPSSRMPLDIVLRTAWVLGLIDAPTREAQQPPEARRAPQAPGSLAAAASASPGAQQVLYSYDGHLSHRQLSPREPQATVDSNSSTLRAAPTPAAQGLARQCAVGSGGALPANAVVATAAVQQRQQGAPRISSVATVGAPCSPLPSSAGPGSSTAVGGSGSGDSGTYAPATAPAPSAGPRLASSSFNPQASPMPVYRQNLSPPHTPSQQGQFRAVIVSQQGAQSSGQHVTHTLQGSSSRNVSKDPGSGAMCATAPQLGQSRPHRESVAGQAPHPTDTGGAGAPRGRRPRSSGPMQQPMHKAIPATPGLVHRVTQDISASSFVTPASPLTQQRVAQAPQHQQPYRFVGAPGGYSASPTPCAAVRSLSPPGACGLATAASVAAALGSGPSAGVPVSMAGRSAPGGAVVRVFHPWKPGA